MYKLLTRTLPGPSVQRYGSPCALAQWRHHRSSKKEKTPASSSAEFLQRFMIPVKKLRTGKHEFLPYVLDVFNFYKDGTRRYVLDMRQLYTMIGRMKRETEPRFTTEELQFQKQMQSAMGKMFPVILLLLVPGTMIFVLPLIHWRGRYLLPHHFLTPKELEEENVLKGHRRAIFGRKLLDVMEADADHIASEKLRQRFLSITGSLRKGGQVKVTDVVPIMELFEETRGVYGPLRVGSRQNYLVPLSELHGMSSFFQQKKLKPCIERVHELLKIDNVIAEDGGPHKLSEDTLKWALYYRGANASYMSKKEMEEWLNEWLKFSYEARKGSPFALLYGPIFLAYNHWR